MITAEQTQRTYWILAEEDGLCGQVDAFLLDRRTRGLASGTLRFYRQKLALFLAYCSENGVHTVTRISPTLIRRYLLWLTDTGHNQGGVHGCYRALRAFLQWWEEEYEPDNWRNPIRKVRGPRQSAEPLPPADWQDVKAMVDTCNHGATAARDRALLLFLVDTGCRAAELLSLDVDDYDPIIGSVTVRQGKGEAIRLDNEAAQQYFVGNAQALKQMEMVETSLRENTKVVITEHGISPTLLLGSLPVSVSNEKNGQKAGIPV